MPQKNNQKPQAIRLNRYLSQCGLASRRKAEDLIATGKIKVNGKLVTSLSTMVHPSDTVVYNGMPVKPQSKVYILVNKPKNTITTKKDPQNRPTIFDWVKPPTNPNIFSIGRLDRNTSGVLLLTNDGNLSNNLTHPSRKIEKVYQVTLDQQVPQSTLKKLLQPQYVDNDYLEPVSLFYSNPLDKQRLVLTIHSGQNRIVKRLFKTWGYNVKNLDRIAFAGLHKNSLKPGAWRYLKTPEINKLMNKAGLLS